MEIGKNVGDYEVLGKLGEGGMGEVWLARDTRLGRKVALKTLPPDLARKSDRLRRFEQEARTVAALNHPNVVTLYSVERAGGLSILTMEYVEGKTLDAVVPDGGLELGHFFGLALPITEAVNAAHQRGITHRDLKPGNIMVTEDGRVKVLDFGLARMVKDAPEVTMVEEDIETRTLAGMVVGTPPYMSPEQFAGRDADQRSDLFSLGIIFFEMLTARRPFSGSSMAEIASSILRDSPPALSQIRTDLSPEIEKVLGDCLEKDRQNRMATASELLEGLTEARQVYFTSRIGTPKTTADKRSDESSRAVAVVDFENIARDPAIDWLSGGIAETIAVDLKKVPSLRIIGRDKVIKTTEQIIQIQGSPDDAAAGQTLGADVVVAGGFQKHGDSIRVTARLVDVFSGEIEGSFRIDGSTNAVFELQDEVVAELTRHLRVSEPETSKAPVKPRTGQLEAFECLAKGRWHVRRMTVADFGTARELITRALTIEPGYALAHAGLGELYSLRFIATTDAENLQTAIFHLRRAIELDPELADPYCWLCYSLLRDDRVEEAVAAGRRAVELDPEATLGHYFLAIALWIQTGKEGGSDLWNEVFAEFDKSRHLVPRYQAAHQMMGVALMFRGRFAEAGEALERAAEIESSDVYDLSRFAGGHAMLARLRLREGELDEAMRLALRSQALLSDRDHVYQTAMLCLTQGVIGDVFLRQQRPAEAIAAYRTAVESAMAHPRGLGVGSVLVRSRLGLARCFQAMDMNREAVTLYEEATDLFRRRLGFDFSWTADVTDSDLYMETALYHAAARHDDEALGSLELAVRSGWGDANLLRDEPLFDEIRTRNRFIEISKRVAASGA